MQRVQFRSLVRALRFHMPCGQNTHTENKKQYCNKFDFWRRLLTWSTSKNKQKKTISKFMWNTETWTHTEFFLGQLPLGVKPKKLRLRRWIALLPQNLSHSSNGNLRWKILVMWNQMSLETFQNVASPSALVYTHNFSPCLKILFTWI